MKRQQIFAVVVCLISTIKTLAADPPANVDFQTDITYANVGGDELKLNLSRPKEFKGLLPCIVVIHGGGWAAGDRKAHNDLTWKFAQRGYVSATVSYRFAPRHPFPAQVQDVKAAVRFLRANAAKYGIDKSRFGAIGFSAGAHLSMMLGTMDKEDGLDDSGGNEAESSKVQAAVSFFGPTDLNLNYPDVTKPILKDFLGTLPKDNPDLAKKASPITYVNAGDAPMLLFQGTRDPLVPHEQAVAMADALTRAGVAGRVELILGAGHGWGGEDLARTANESFLFFDGVLKKEKK